MHISDDSTLQLVGDIGSPYFQNGPDLYDHIESLVVIPPTTSELFDMKAALAGKADEKEGAKATGVSREESIANIAQTLAENARQRSDPGLKRPEVSLGDIRVLVGRVGYRRRVSLDQVCHGGSRFEPVKALLVVRVPPRDHVLPPPPARNKCGLFAAF
jgi:hypothetical protein